MLSTSDLHLFDLKPLNDNPNSLHTFPILHGKLAALSRYRMTMLFIVETSNKDMNIELGTSIPLLPSLNQLIVKDNTIKNTQSNINLEAAPLLLMPNSDLTLVTEPSVPYAQTLSVTKYARPEDPRKYIETPAIQFQNRFGITISKHYSHFRVIYSANPQIQTGSIIMPFDNRKIEECTSFSHFEAIDPSLLPSYMRKQNIRKKYATSMGARTTSLRTRAGVALAGLTGVGEDIGEKHITSMKAGDKDLDGNPQDGDASMGTVMGDTDTSGAENPANTESNYSHNVHIEDVNRLNMHIAADTPNRSSSTNKKPKLSTEHLDHIVIYICDTRKA
jgi:hypothetical protein